MKKNFCIVLEKTENPFIQTIEFFGSSIQAIRVFNTLSFALCNSDYEAIHLFCGEDEVNSAFFNRNKVPTFKKSEA